MGASSLRKRLLHFFSIWVVDSLRLSRSHWESIHFSCIWISSWSDCLLSSCCQHGLHLDGEIVLSTKTEHSKSIRFYHDIYGSGWSHCFPLWFLPYFILLILIWLIHLIFSQVCKLNLKLRFALLEDSNLGFRFSQVKYQTVILFLALDVLLLHLFYFLLILADLLHIGLKVHLFDLLFATSHGAWPIWISDCVPSHDRRWHGGSGLFVGICALNLNGWIKPTNITLLELEGGSRVLIAFQALLASKALLYLFLGYIQGANSHDTCNLLHHTLQAELGGICPLFELMA